MTKFGARINLNQILKAIFNDKCIKFKVSIAPIKDINSRFFSTHKNKVSTKFSTQNDQICAFKPKQIFAQNSTQTSKHNLFAILRFKFG